MSDPIADNLDEEVNEARLDEMRAIVEADRAAGKMYTAYQLSKMTSNPDDNLLGEYWLTRGHAVLLVAPSGVGKSSVSSIQNQLWSLGREAFGLKPTRKLRILTIQAENSEHDMIIECKSLRHYIADPAFFVSDDEMSESAERCVIIRESGKCGPTFMLALEAHLYFAQEAGKPFDIIRIDPLNAFSGGDPVDTQRMIDFLRNQLNPLLEKYRVGAIVVHHTPKTTGQKRDDWKPHDFSYVAAGCADITNWARGILYIEPTWNPEVFRFMIPKRHAEANWKDESGAALRFRFFAHAGDGITSRNWRTATIDEINKSASNPDKGAAATASNDRETAMGLLPETGIMPKSTFERRCQAEGMSVRRTAAVIQLITDEECAFIHKVKRSGLRDAVLIGRTRPDPQATLGGDVDAVKASKGRSRMKKKAKNRDKAAHRNN